MKTCTRTLLTLLTYFALITAIHAQKATLPDNIGLISASEKSNYMKVMKPHSSNLLNNYDLKYHRLQWLVDPAQNAIRGSVTSYYVPTTSGMSSIQFELAPEMVADSAFHRGFHVGVNHTSNLITISFGEIIPQGHLDSVTVYYHGNPPGSGFGSFGTGLHNGIPALWTLSEPYGCSDWWPSKNDLTDKIDSIDVFVAAPKAYRVASNGLMMGESAYGPNLNLTHWKHRYPIASYLIAIAVTNYAVSTQQFNGPGGNFPIVNYSYPEDSAFNSTQTALLMPVYELYGTLFGNYPYEHEKYGHAEFGWGGGMEHQTMTFIGQGAYNIEILSHELAHQWFGDLVTCGSWHDIWLNEGFATYCAGLMYEKLHPNDYWPIWKKQNISWVTYFPDGSVYCTDTTDVNRIFDSRLSYSKGGMVLHQLRWILGDNAFFEGMRSYIEDPALRFGFAMTSQYREHMEAASGKNLVQYFDDWIYKEGYPSYQVTYFQDEQKSTLVTLKQTQSDPSVEFFKLPVPLKFYGEGRDSLMVFDNSFSGEAFVVNPGFVIDSVHFDPDYQLITANNQVALGRDELPAGKGFVISPNPVQDKLIATHNLGSLEKVQVSNLTGQDIPFVMNENSQNRLVLDIPGLKPGIYILTTRSRDFLVSRKFIVQE